MKRILGLILVSIATLGLLSTSTLAAPKKHKAKAYKHVWQIVEMKGTVIGKKLDGLYLNKKLCVNAATLASKKFVYEGKKPESVKKHHCVRVQLTTSLR